MRSFSERSSAREIPLNFSYSAPCLRERFFTLTFTPEKNRPSRINGIATNVTVDFCVTLLDLTDRRWLSKAVHHVSIDKDSIYEARNLVIPRSII